jgi:uncharacterized coiled-coil protein SlyX
VAAAPDSIAAITADQAIDELRRRMSDLESKSRDQAHELDRLRRSLSELERTRAEDQRKLADELARRDKLFAEHAHQYEVPRGGDFRRVTEIHRDCYDCWVAVFPNPAPSLNKDNVKTSPPR